MRLMIDAAGRISVAALFKSLGALDDEIEPAYRILQRSPVPESMPDVVSAARDALTLARQDMGRWMPRGGTTTVGDNRS